MNKTLRIVAKDARHLWPEILVSLAITAGFIATDHFGWPQYSNNPFHEAGTLRVWMQILMPITWWLLVSRAVHDESLVGDRQFWITRPYGWPRVLAAKLIFIATFILFPYLLAQIILLQEAHLHPLNVLPGLAFTLAAIFVLFLLPLLALATVTSTISRIFIIFFGLVVYAGLVAYFSSIFLTSPEWVPGSDTAYVKLAIIVAIVIAAGVTLLQYSLRRTRLAVVLLLVMVAVFTTGNLATARSRHHLEDFAHVGSGEVPPVTVTLNPDPRYQYPLPSTPEAQVRNDTDNSPVDIPLIFSGIQSGHAVRIDAQTLTISANGQQTRTIPWERIQQNFRSDDASNPWIYNTGPLLTESRQQASIQRWIYREFSGKKVNMHLTYAVTELEPEVPAAVSFDGHAADVPENGHCLQYPGTERGDTGIVCQYAVAAPSLTRVTWKLYLSCDALSGTSMNEELWVGDTDRAIREADLSPVIPLHSYFTTNNSPYNDRRPYRFCPGTTLTFTKYHVLRRRLIEANLPPLDPRLYVAPSKAPQSALPAAPAPTRDDSE